MLFGTFLTVFHIQGIFAILVLSVIITVQRKYRLTPLSECTSNRSSPFLSIVLVCKGIHDQSLNNWKAILSSRSFNTEFIFVVEAESDPAYLPLKKLVTHNSRAKLIISDFSFHNAQKIHNQLAGVAACDAKSQYIAFVDDDIRVHDRVFDELMASFADPQVLAATGYCYEAPLPKAGFCGLLLMIYRLLNLGSFSGLRTRHMWGGFMMFQTSTFRRNLYGIVDVWRDGGYSDDMATVALCKKFNRTIASVPTAVFPNYLSEHITFSRYFNFLTRQLFVCLTYSSVDNWLQNLGLLALNPLSFIGFGLPMISAFIVILYSFIMFPFLNSPLPSTSVVVSAIFLIASMSVITICLIRLVKTLHFCSCRDLGTVIDNEINLPFLGVGCALFVHLLIAAFASLFVSLTKKIVWANVVYHRQAGRIVKIEREEVENLNFFDSVSRALSVDFKSNLVINPDYAVLEI
ncbi:hypothetical protein RCL1_000660 [Eukaryota sp. TZLM3-RCL]